MLVHPRQREGLRVSEKMIRTCCINSVALKGEHRDVNRRPETEVLGRSDSTCSRKD